MPKTYDELIIWKLRYSSGIESKGSWLTYYTDYYLYSRVHQSQNTTNKIQNNPGIIAHFHSRVFHHIDVWVAYMSEHFPEHVQTVVSRMHKDTYIAGMKIVRKIGSMSV